MKLPKTTQHTKSTEVIASIDDLLIEILLRLPVKSILRFKIVSKHWHSLITNPEFCLRRNPNPNPVVGLFLPRTNFRINPLFEYLPFRPNSSTIPPFIKDPFGVTVLQSCNGLLLCSSFWAERGNNTKYYVYNPTTNQFSTLPKSDGISTRIRGMSLALDPAKSPHYKVVCVRDLKSVSDSFSLFEDESVSDSEDHQYRLEIYSPETGAWRLTGEPFAAQVNFENGVYWNDAIHWMGYAVGDSLYFNIHRHVLEKMPDWPMHEDGYGRWEYYFGESCDHLHYIQICNSQIKFTVYEMMRDYSEWFVKYRVDLSLVVDANPSMIKSYSDEVLSNYYNFSMYSIVRDAEEEISFLVLQIPEKAIRYNLVSKTFETLRESEGADILGPFIFSATKGFQYFESLCSVYCFLPYQISGLLKEKWQRHVSKVV